MNLLLIMRPLLVFLAITLGSGAAAAEKPRDFAFGIPLTLTPDRAFYRVALPAAFYEGSARADQADLRVFNGDGAAVPYARLDSPALMHEKKPPANLVFFPLRVDERGGDLRELSLTVNKHSGKTSVSLSTSDGKSVSPQRLAGYLIDAGPLREPIAALRFGWMAGRGATQTRIRIEGSEDLNQWRTLVADAPLLDLEYGGRRLLRDRIELGQVRAAYLRISWPSSQLPLELDEVRAEFSDRLIDTPRQWTEAKGSAVPDNENAYQFDLGAALPVDRIGIELPELNSVAPAQLAARATTQEPWRTITSLVAYRLRHDSGEISAPPVTSAPVSYRHWLLRIDPKSGGLGRGEPRIRAGWIPHEIVFAARGTPPFLIAYGNVGAPSSALPVTTLVPGYGSDPQALESIGIARAGAAAPLGNLEQARPRREYRTALLWATLVLGVVALAWMAWQLSRQLNASSTSNASPTPPKPPKADKDAADH